MLSDEILSRLRDIVGADNVFAAQEDLDTYAYDATSTWFHPPDAVVMPTTTEQVADVVKLANEEKIPLTPRGGGTNVSGGSVPIRGGIVLATAKMNRILSIDAENMTATCECGVVLHDLNLALAEKKLFFAPDPQSFLGATMGGIVAENSGGPAGVKYGVAKNYVLGVKVVLPTGDVVDFGGTTVKNVVGYDLALLITGSEGTLGVVCEATFKLLPLPAAKRTILAVFDEVATAGKNVGSILKAGIIPAKIELLDNWVIRSIERIMSMGLPVDAGAMLMFEVDGTPESVEKDAAGVIETCKANGAKEIKVASDPAEAMKYWKARGAGFAAVFGAAPTVLAEDVTVPRSRIPDFIERVSEICKKDDLEYTVIGHAGDGNLHPSVLTDIKDEAHFNKAKAAVDKIIEAAVEFGGVLSGEHGIGLEKQKFLRRAVDEKVIDLMKKIKDVFDPNGIMNPGKIWES
ncbi:MAG: FAD-binding oxidoreductase [Planctomycetota bacterium]|jgi:glycolate oxidase